MQQRCDDCDERFGEGGIKEEEHITHMHNCAIYAENMAGQTFPCFKECGKTFITEMEQLVHIDQCFGVVDTSESFNRSKREIAEKTDAHSFATHTRSFLENLCMFNRFEDGQYLATLGLVPVQGEKNKNAEIKGTIYAMLSIATGISKTTTKGPTSPSIQGIVGDTTNKTLWSMVMEMLWWT